jgi:ribA/ribD-fused uncharacterized protein
MPEPTPLPTPHAPSNDALADLVARFSAALLDKLRAAEAKYGWSDAWMHHENIDAMRRDLLRHVEKGDPRDVAAYCAFLWYHEASTAQPPAARPAVTEAMECHGLDTPERVRFYEHDFYVLSNFSAFAIWDGGFLLPTSEHAYHWYKFPERPDISSVIRNATSAHEAFKLAEAHRADRRADWDAVKVDIMRRILWLKVNQHEYVRRKLLATGTRELVEDSWRDDFWGWGPNRDGQNMLGKLWMEIRSALTAAREGGE